MKRKSSLSAIAIVLVVAGWFFFAPKQIGGTTSFAMISGISMEPLYHQGDLVILKQRDDYKVGDIVGYINHDLKDTLVLHKIIAHEGDTYTFQGINNNFIDDARPTKADLVGQSWIHISRGGALMEWLRKPRNAAILVLLAGLLAGGGNLYHQSGRRDRRSRSNGSGGAMNFNFPRLDQRAVPAAAAIAGVFALIALMAFNRPLQRAESLSNYYTQSGTLAYQAKAAPSAVYPNGKIQTGDTVFTRLAGPVRLSFNYKLSSAEAPVKSEGTAQYLIRIEGDTLWNREEPLGPPVKLSNPSTQLKATLDLAKLKALLEKVESDTGFISNAAYKLTIIPVVHQTGRVGDTVLKETFAPEFPMRFDKVRFFPDNTVTGTGEPTTNFSSSQDGAGTRMVGNTLDLRVVTLSVPTARRVGLIGALLGLILLACAMLLLRFRRGEDEPTQIEQTYSDWLVPVSGAPDLPSAPADVASFEALLALADRYDRAIMHHANDGVHTYLVKEEDIVYRYIAFESETLTALQSYNAARSTADAPAEANGATTAPRPSKQSK